MKYARKPSETVPWCDCHKRHVVGFTKATDGWWVCANCYKPAILTLNECDSCPALFRGIPNCKLAYTCPVCEGKEYKGVA